MRIPISIPLVNTYIFCYQITNLPCSLKIGDAWTELKILWICTKSHFTFCQYVISVTSLASSRHFSKLICPFGSLRGNWHIISYKITRSLLRILNCVGKRTWKGVHCQDSKYPSLKEKSMVQVFCKFDCLMPFLYNAIQLPVFVSNNYNEKVLYRLSKKIMSQGKICLYFV